MTLLLQLTGAVVVASFGAVALTVLWERRPWRK